MLFGRLHADGTYDNSFAGDGLLIEHFLSGNYNVGRSILIFDDGKILTGGYSYYSPNEYAQIIKYNSDGIKDTTFGVAGIFKPMF